jgi:hypothetical protein
MPRGKTVNLDSLETQRVEDEVKRAPRKGGSAGFKPNENIQSALVDTYNNGGSVDLLIPTADTVGSAKSQIRRNAEALQPALSVLFEEIENDDDSVTLRFQGTKKRPYAPRKAKETVDA